MRVIQILDTTLRDGEQSAGVNLNTNEKKEIAKQLVRLGVDAIEAGFPIASPGDFQAVKTIADEVKGATIVGFARATKGDIDAVYEAIKNAEQARIHMFIATSPIHMKYKLRKSPDEVIEIAVEMIKYAKKYFQDIQFSAEDAGRSDLDYLVRFTKEVIDAGATIVNIPDTVGYMMPREYGYLFKHLKEQVPNSHKALFSAHCHDDLGMAVANTLAAIENGVDQVEGTINGIGERAGNAALEEVAVSLYTRQDYYQATTKMNLEQIARSSKLISKLTGMIVPGNKAIVGANAFAHESGIHQDGVLKERTTYEIIRPDLVGYSSNKLVLGKHSGRHAFRERLIALGYVLSDEQINVAFQKFKELTMKKKEIFDDDLMMIIDEQQLKQSAFELEYFHISGDTSISTAMLRMKLPNGESKEEAAHGEGLVDSVYNTIDRISGLNLKLKDYQIKSVGYGRDAVGSVHVKVEYNGELFNGRGMSTNVIEASAKAYIDALNRIYVKHGLNKQELKEQEIS
ncbi:2-isopropylmalate synthase [Tepidibacillus fermentans]|uniref:2-isopropylmalate synthase n=1 Tax=Tepidibacillus fermentans TaxID=1281767 RepID=A0A4R3KI50_9BACI|nr:2-isopropylmalate synthase [Tepidibacillus fermentans]TCS83193.1 2-isopropylmalate synthase [Tepidibacillus fermentans]